MSRTLTYPLLVVQVYIYSIFLSFYSFLTSERLNWKVWTQLTLFIRIAIEENDVIWSHWNLFTIKGMYFSIFYLGKLSKKKNDEIYGIFHMLVDPTPQTPQHMEMLWHLIIYFKLLLQTNECTNGQRLP